jgi:hypothetical protein
MVTIDRTGATVLAWSTLRPKRAWQALTGNANWMRNSNKGDKSMTRSKLKRTKIQECSPQLLRRFLAVDPAICNAPRMVLRIVVSANQKPLNCTFHERNFQSRRNAASDPTELHRPRPISRNGAMSRIGPRVLAELGHSSFQIRPLVTQKLMATTDRQPTSELCRSRPLGTTPRRPLLTPPAPSWGRFFPLGGVELG